MAKVVDNVSLGNCVCFCVIHRERCYCSSCLSACLCMLVGVGIAHVIIASVDLVKCVFFLREATARLGLKWS